MSDLNSIWRDLEGEMPPARLGRLQRVISPDAPVELSLAVTNPGLVHSFAMTVPTDVAGEVDAVPEAVGLRCTFVNGDDEQSTILEIALEDESVREVFTVLARDIIDAAAQAPDGDSAIRAWISRLRRWQKMLQRSAAGLSSTEQRGLFAELHILRDWMTPSLGVDRALRAWMGPLKGVHDFHTRVVHLEVKSSIAGQPQVMRINGERQLDDTGTPGLAIVHLSLAMSREEGESLPSMVESVRGVAAGEIEEGLLEDRLVEVGYSDAHEPKYRNARYTLRESRLFRVEPNFPRIVEADLADGIGDVDYQLAVAACEDFEMDEGELVVELKEAYP